MSFVLCLTEELLQEQSLNRRTLGKAFITLIANQSNVWPVGVQVQTKRNSSYYLHRSTTPTPY